jgi:hypothetical protein
LEAKGSLLSSAQLRCTLIIAIALACSVPAGWLAMKERCELRKFISGVSQLSIAGTPFGLSVQSKDSFATPTTDVTTDNHVLNLVN